jgi:hypothetical protein
MTALRNLSPRPTFLRDQDTHQVVDPVPNFIGVPGPLGRHRIVSTLPMAPTLLKPPAVVKDQNGSYLADPSGALIGFPKVIVHRMLSARWTEDTRRLAG